MKSKILQMYRRLSTLVTDFQLDVVAAYTAGTAWFIMLSFIPFMIMLLSLLQYFPFSEEAFSYFDTEFIPLPIRDLTVSLLTDISEDTPSYVLPVAAFTGLISASTGVDSLMKGLNIVYGRHEKRSFWKARLYCLLYTVVLLAIIVAVLAVLVFGVQVYRVLSRMITVLPAENILMRFRFLVVPVLLTLFFTLLYNTIPNHRVRWYGEVAGAAVASIMWMVYSMLYSLYISYSGKISALYGSLTVIIIFMIWLYSCVFIVYIGAYINVLLQSAYQKRKERLYESK